MKTPFFKGDSFLGYFDDFEEPVKAVEENPVL